MSWRGTVVLFLLAVGAGLYLWFEEPPPAPPRQPATLLGEPISPPEEESPPLLPFEPGKVAHLRLQQGLEVRQARRQEGIWQGATSAREINDFLDNLAGLARILGLSEDAKDLPDYGLEPAQAVIELWQEDRAEPLVLEIGDRNPSTTGVYARVNRRGAVVLAGALLIWEFEKAFDALPAQKAAANP